MLSYTVIPPNSQFLGLRKNRIREFGCLIKVPRVWRSQGLKSSERNRELENFASLEPRVCEVLLYSLSRRNSCLPGCSSSQARCEIILVYRIRIRHSTSTRICRISVNHGRPWHYLRTAHVRLSCPDVNRMHNTTYAGLTLSSCRNMTSFLRATNTAGIICKKTM